MVEGNSKVFAVDVQIQRDGDIEFHFVHIAGCEVAKRAFQQKSSSIG
jgi:uncharacterized protein (DUF1919 family)